MQLAHTKLIFACFMGFLVNGYYCNLILLRTNKPYIYPPVDCVTNLFYCNWIIKVCIPVLIPLDYNYFIWIQNSSEQNLLAMRNESPCSHYIPPCHLIQRFSIHFMSYHVNSHLFILGLHFFFYKDVLILFSTHFSFYIDVDSGIYVITCYNIS